MRRKLELLKLQIKSAFLSIPKIILGTIVTAVLVIAISTCIGIATAQDSDMRMKVAVVYPDYDDTENSDSADNNKEFRYIKMAFNYVSEIDTIKNVCTFEYTDRQQAIDGLRNNYYVMAIIVPENMISDIMSGENTPVEVVCQSEVKDKRFDEIVNQYSCFSHEIGISALGQELTACGYALYNLDEDDIYLLELIPQAEMEAFEKKCHKYGQYCKLLKQPHRDFGIQARHIAPRKQMPRMQMVWPNDNICYIT